MGTSNNYFYITFVQLFQNNNFYDIYLQYVQEETNVAENFV